MEDISSSNFGLQAKDLQDETQQSSTNIRDAERSGSRLYIMTLNVLAPYRRRGVRKRSIEFQHH